MKKTMSIIIVLASLLLTSCASATPAGSTELSWITSVISTTASAQVGTSATAGTTQTESTSMTTQKTGGTTPSEPFLPSGYVCVTSSAFETRSKVMLKDFKGFQALYYYSKADGEFYPFCFDPFCNHKRNGDQSPGCLAAVLLYNGAYYQSVSYINSRIYFPWRGSIYSCSEFATDLRLEIELEKFESAKQYSEAINSGGVTREIFQNFFCSDDSIFFNYVDPNGEVGWYKYDTSTQQLKRMNDDLKALGDSLGVELVVSDIAFGYIYMFGYKNAYKNQYGELEGDFAGGYICDLNLKNAIKTEEKNETYTLFRMSDGILRKDKSRYGGTSNYDVILLKSDGTVETFIKDVRNTLGLPSAKLLYYVDGYFYFVSLVRQTVGYVYYWRGYELQETNGDGNLYRYNVKTGKVETVFSCGGTDHFDILHVEFVDMNERIALITSQTEVETEEMHNGMPVVEGRHEIIKCHLDENGIVESFEIVEID